MLIGGIVYLLVKWKLASFMRRNSLFLYLAFIILLLITYFSGIEAMGSKSWLSLYFFNFQTSEFFKIVFILFLSNFLSQHKYDLKNPIMYFVILLIYVIPAIVVLIQPDLGSTVLITFIFFVMVALSNIPKRYVLFTLLIIFISLPIGWNFMHDYQKERITAFINPEDKMQAGAYNMIQSIITVGSGKFFGRGLGLGKQTTLFFLPENHTDFAYSSLVEQFGFVGGITVIVLYIFIAVVLIQRMIFYFNGKEKDSQAKFLYIVGFFAFFVVQIFVNIGMNLGLMPITGIALPLISYGGSSLVTWMFGLALLP
jgi:rod shape determining protein RodA